jgi:AcrR family transcriptional regulator
MMGPSVKKFLMISSELMESGTLRMIASEGERTVTQPGSAPRSRQQRRKERTRAALVRGAQALLAAGKTDASIMEITRAADVGMGSFYNHFDSKDQLFQAALKDALDAHGELLEQLTAGLDDPAEVFACSFRLTGRLHRRQPEVSKVLLHNALALARSDRGLAPRARRDLDAATRAGRFAVDDPELAVAVIAGATLCLGQLLHDQPERDDAHATDQLTEDLLRMLGVPAAEAHRICLRPLPDPGDPAGHEPQNVGTRPSVPTPPGATRRTA